MTASKITVRKHRGHSGLSVFEWRVFREGNDVKPFRFQLAKYRTQEAAERAAEYYRKNDARVAALKSA